MAKTKDTVWYVEMRPPADYDQDFDASYDVETVVDGETITNRVERRRPFLRILTVQAPDEVEARYLADTQAREIARQYDSPRYVITHLNEGDAKA